MCYTKGKRRQRVMLDSTLPRDCSASRGGEGSRCSHNAGRFSHTFLEGASPEGVRAEVGTAVKGSSCYNSPGAVKSFVLETETQVSSIK